MMKLLAVPVVVAVLLCCAGTLSQAQSQKDVDESAAVEINGRAEVVSSVVLHGNTRERFNSEGDGTTSGSEEVTDANSVGYVQISGVSDDVGRIDINAPSSFILTHDLLYDPENPHTYVDGSINVLEKGNERFPVGITTGDLYIDIDVESLAGRLNGTYSTWLPIAVTFCAY